MDILISILVALGVFTHSEAEANIRCDADVAIYEEAYQSQISGYDDTYLFSWEEWDEQD